MTARPVPVASAPIGLYDSGVGGLTVLDTLMRQLPGESYVYYGDTLHMPYGSKSPAEIRRLVTGLIRFLCEAQQVKLVAVACNTSAGVLYDELARLCPVPLVEPITPICRWLGEAASFRKVGLLATPTTVQSNRYASVLAGFNPSIQLQQVPCDGLAKLVETGQTHSEACRALLKRSLDPLVDWGVEAIILGCTHYPHARDVMASLLPPSVQLLDPAEYMGAAVREALEQRNLQAKVPQGKLVSCHVSQNPGLFRETAEQLPLKQVRLESVPTLTVVNPPDCLAALTSFEEAPAGL